MPQYQYYDPDYGYDPYYYDSAPSFGIYLGGGGNYYHHDHDWNGNMGDQWKKWDNH